MRKRLELGRKVADYCERTHMGAYAAQSAFFLLVSAMPFLMIFGSLIRFLSGKGELVLEQLLELLPEYLTPFFAFLLREAIANHPGFLSVTALVAIWSAGKGIQSMMEGLNSARGVKDTPEWLRLRLRAVFYVFLLVVAAAAVNLILLFLPFAKIWVFFLLCAVLPLIFCVWPDDTTNYLKELPSGILCAVGWYLFSWGMWVYIRYFRGFSMYGNLAAVVPVMLWLYCCMYWLLICSCISPLMRNMGGLWRMILGRMDHLE